MLLGLTIEHIQKLVRRIEVLEDRIYELEMDRNGLQQDVDYLYNELRNIE